MVIHLDSLLSLFLHTSFDIEIQFMSRNSLTVISITNKDSFFNSILDQCFDDDLHSYWHGGKKKKVISFETLLEGITETCKFCQCQTLNNVGLSSGFVKMKLEVEDYFERSKSIYHFNENNSSIAIKWRIISVYIEISLRQNIRFCIKITLPSIAQFL